MVVLKEGSQLSHPDLAGYLEEEMPRFMVPRYLEFVDTLPKTPTEKVRKVELRAAGNTDSTWDREASGFLLPD